MYQCSSYPDPFPQSLCCDFSAAQSPPPLHHHDYSHHPYPPSPPQGPSSPSELGGGGGYLSPAASYSHLPTSYLQSSGNSAFALHMHLLDRDHHYGGGGGGGLSSGYLYDQPDFFDFQSAMQGTNSLQPPLPGLDNCSQEVGGEAADMAGGKVGRYSAEERRERIERYRSKRNQRNFQKKITYACRKTLADSRPRVRGRFARNGEAEPEAEGEVSSYNNSSSQSGADCFGWRPAEDDDEYGGDPDFWANFLDGLAANNPVSW